MDTKQNIPTKDEKLNDYSTPVEGEQEFRQVLSPNKTIEGSLCEDVSYVIDFNLTEKECSNQMLNCDTSSMASLSSEHQSSTVPIGDVHLDTCSKKNKSKFDKIIILDVQQIKPPEEHWISNNILDSNIDANSSAFFAASAQLNSNNTSELEESANLQHQEIQVVNISSDVEVSDVKAEDMTHSISMIEFNLNETTSLKKVPYPNVNSTVAVQPAEPELNKSANLQHNKTSNKVIDISSDFEEMSLNNTSEEVASACYINFTSADQSSNKFENTESVIVESVDPLSVSSIDSESHNLPVTLTNVNETVILEKADVTVSDQCTSSSATVEYELNTTVAVQKSEDNILNEITDFFLGTGITSFEEKKKVEQVKSSQTEDSSNEVDAEDANCTAVDTKVSDCKSSREVLPPAMNSSVTVQPAEPELNKSAINLQHNMTLNKVIDISSDCEEISLNNTSEEVTNSGDITESVIPEEIDLLSVSSIGSETHSTVTQLNVNETRTLEKAEDTVPDQCTSPSATVEYELNATVEVQEMEDKILDEVTGLFLESGATHFQEEQITEQVTSSQINKRSDNNQHTNNAGTLNVDDTKVSENSQEDTTYELYPGASSLCVGGQQTELPLNAQKLQINQSLQNQTIIEGDESKITEEMESIPLNRCSGLIKQDPQGFSTSLLSAFENLRLDYTGDETFASCVSGDSLVVETNSESDSDTMDDISNSEFETEENFRKTEVVDIPEDVAAGTGSIDTKVQESSNFDDINISNNDNQIFESQGAIPKSRKSVGFSISSMPFLATPPLIKQQVNRMEEKLYQEALCASPSVFNENFSKYQVYLNLQFERNHLQQEIAKLTLDVKKKERQMIELYPQKVLPYVVKSDENNKDPAPELVQTNETIEGLEQKKELLESLQKTNEELDTLREKLNNTQLEYERMKEENVRLKELLIRADAIPTKLVFQFERTLQQEKGKFEGLARNYQELDEKYQRVKAMLIEMRDLYKENNEKLQTQNAGLRNKFEIFKKMALQQIAEANKENERIKLETEAKCREKRGLSRKN